LLLQDKVDRSETNMLYHHQNNPIQKLNCVYCAYGNGLLKYSLMIAAMTEAYWCGIRHEHKEGFVEPSHHKDFIDYDDEEAFNSIYAK